MKVFKFGGASVNSADSIRNMGGIVGRNLDMPLVVVISAMGKTTNLLERLVPGVSADEAECRALLDQSLRYHLDIAETLFGDAAHAAIAAVRALYGQLEEACSAAPTHYNADYDRVVSFGELISTTLIAGYLQHIGIDCQWVDVRQVIRTDHTHREGRVDFEATTLQARQLIGQALQTHRVVVTQGFIAGADDGSATTLGREGSDYSASILAYCLDASSVTVWKNVLGFLNADPRYFADTIKINKIPYNEAIELAYYGASVIHPKTVKPLQNKGIVLEIKSFLEPDAEGSHIGPYIGIDPLTPLYIFKDEQVLISVLPRDFSFIAEDNLQSVFAILAELNVRVNMMQNSAISFSFCIDRNEVLLRQLQDRLSESFYLRYSDGLQLITIRYYNQAIIDRIVSGRTVLMQQYLRTTTQLLVE